MVSKINILIISFVGFSFLSAISPLADPGPNRVVNFGETVILDGTGSRDPDGGAIVSYQWTAPDGITLSYPHFPDSSIATFVAPNELDTLTFSLIVVDDQDEVYQPYPSTDLFISEYGEGSSPGENQYIELYNGTLDPIDLTGYELWLMKGTSTSGMTWEEPDWGVLIFNDDDDSYSDWVNSQSSNTWSLSDNSDCSTCKFSRVDVDPIMPGETLFIMRGEPNFDYSGQNYVVWSRLSKMTGDDPVGLINSDGVRIDQIGDDADPTDNGSSTSAGWDVAGVTAATKDHMLVRKPNVVSGNNTDWLASSGTNADDSEWEVLELNDFSNTFIHECRSCSGEINILVLDKPLAKASYIPDNLIFNESESDISTANEICSETITLDASLSLSFTGNISYQWIEGQLENGVYDEGEEFEDRGNELWDEGEEFVDLGNGIYDEGEDFTDALNFEYDDGETFVDGLNGIYDQGEDFIDGNSIYDEGEVFVDELNGVYDEGEEFVDALNGVYDSLEDFTDINGNGIFDAGLCHTVVGYIWIDFLTQQFCEQSGHVWSSEPFIDSNMNGEYDDEGEEFDDALNGVYDEGEEFTDELNGVWNYGEEFTDALNGVWDEGEVFIDLGNGEYEQGEEFDDVNQDGLFNFYCMDSQGDWNNNFENSWSCENVGHTWLEEEYTDIGNGIYDEGEGFADALNGVWDEGEIFIDALNGVWDEGEEFIDELNGIYDYGEEFTDALNGIWDEGEEFTDELNGVWDYGEEFTDALNGVWDEGEIFIDALNGVWDEDEEFVDIGNGLYDEGEYFWDTGNGVWDDEEEFTDIDNNGICNDNEPFVDADGDGKWDSAELFFDSYQRNIDACQQRGGEWFALDKYSFCDEEGESTEGNETWDQGEELINVFPNTFVAINNNYTEDDCLEDGGTLNGDVLDEEEEVIFSVITPGYSGSRCILDSEELSKRRPVFNSTTGSFCDIDDYDDMQECLCNDGEWIDGEVLHGDFTFILVVDDGLLESLPGSVDININDNLCSEPLINVVEIEYLSFCDENCNYLYDEGEDDNESLCNASDDGKVWLTQVPHLIEKNNGILIYEQELFSDKGNGSWDTGESFDDKGNLFYDGPEPFDDLNGNCIFDEREPHQNDYSSSYAATLACDNLNGVWTYLGSTLGNSQWNGSQGTGTTGFNSYYFCDLNGDGIWESGETFYDCNSIRSICEYDSNWTDDLGNGIYDHNLESQEDFIDVDNNCYWSIGEEYLDLGNGVYDEGEAFDDIGNGIWDEGEDFTDINQNGVWDSRQKVLLTGLNSFDRDPGSEIVSYQWEEISGLLSPGEIEVVDSLSSEGGVISFYRPEFNNAEDYIDENQNGVWDWTEPFTDLNGNSLWDSGYGDVQFSLRVYDGISYSISSVILTVRFRSPSAPDIPSLYARVEGQYIEGEESVGVVLSWAENSKNSVDRLTGYYDFEGYKLYKSTDGGNTWGTENDKIYVNGEFKGWKPFRQFDYTRDQDLEHCIYANDACAGGNRNVDVTGYDQYSYWINLGDNTGLTHFYFDDDIINGVEYTYAITAYDTGIWATYESDVTGLTEWYDSNPNHYMNLDGSGFPSIESALVDLDEGKNIISVLPGYYAEDVYFPTFSETNTVIVEDEYNEGHGLVSYQVTNLDELENRLIKFEVEADPRSDFNAFENLHTENPRMYGFYLGSDGHPEETISIPYYGLLNSEIDSLLDLPGSYSEDDMIYHPIYEIENHEIKFFEDDDFSAFDHYTDFISGTRMQFTNPIREYGWTREIYIDFSDLEDLIYFPLGASDNVVPIIGKKFYPKEEGKNLYRRVGYTLKFNYDNSTTTFDNRPPYSYRLEFSKNADYEVHEVKQNGLGDCAASPSNTRVPFKVINTYTGHEVGLRHIDLGWHNGGLFGQVPYLAEANGCEDEISIADQGNFTGDCDCNWSFYEDVVFVLDTVTTASNAIPHPEVTYSLELNSISSGYLSSEPWGTISYNEGSFVTYAGMKWISRTEDYTDSNGNGEYDFSEDFVDENQNGRWDSGDNTNPLCPPGPMFCDPNGDGVDDSGSWKVVYPWDDFDGDIYIEIEPWTWFADGDNWTADIGEIGRKQEITSDMLSEVTVAPNPYRASSDYSNAGIYFNHLPTECEINIFTISGERVFKHQFNSTDGPNPGAAFYGSYEWNLENEKGESIAPGLYIYTVESLDYKNKHIGKFAIVR